MKESNVLAIKSLEKAIRQDLDNAKQSTRNLGRVQFLFLANKYPELKTIEIINYRLSAYDGGSVIQEIIVNKRDKIGEIYRPCCEHIVDFMHHFDPQCPNDFVEGEKVIKEKIEEIEKEYKKIKLEKQEMFFLERLADFLLQCAGESRLILDRKSEFLLDFSYYDIDVIKKFNL